MKADTLRVLLVEDNPGDARLVREMLRECAAPTFAVEHVTRLAEGLDRLERERFDVVLLDLNLPDSAGLAGVETLGRRGPGAPIIVLTGLDDESTGMEALRAHASDYLVKGRIDAPALARSIRYAIERAHAEKALRESEHRYRSLFDGMTEGFSLQELICDDAGRPSDFRFLEVNEAFERITGLRAAAVIGRTYRELLPGDNADLPRVLGEVALTGTPVHFENYSSLLGRYYEIYAYRAAPRQFAAVFTDVSERKRKEDELWRLNRTLLAHSQSDNAMVRASDEAAYLAEVCRIVVEDCGHAMVWVGFAQQDEGRTIRAVAHAGLEEGYLETLNLTWADDERGRGPTGTAIRTGKPVICRNMLTDPAFAPWREQALARGYAASIALPLTAEGRTFGALTIYSRFPDPFSDDEVALLSSLADDLAYGVSAIRTRQAHVLAESALRTSERRYRSLVELSPEAVLVATSEKVEFANPAAVRLFGAASEEDLVGRSPLELFHPETHERMRQRIRKLQAGQVVSPVESRIVRLDGEVREVEVAAGPTEVAGGGAAQAILRDITERKRMENELREARDYLESLINYANAPIIVWDPEFRITRFNRAFERLTGRRAEDVIGAPVEILFPPGRRAEAFGHIRRAEAGERWETVEIPIMRVDGEIRTVLWNSATLFDASGKHVLATIAQGHDITQRKRAEDERERLLREVETERARLRTVIDTAPEAIVFTDKEARILLANPAAERLLGGAARSGATLERHEALRLSRADAAPGGERSLPITRAAVAGEVSTQVEVLATRDDGVGRNLLVSAAPILDSQGVSAGAVGVFQDITQRKRAEEALSAALIQTRRRSEEVSALLVAARAVIEHRVFTPAAGAIFDSCRGLLGAEIGYLALCSDDGGSDEVVHMVLDGGPGPAQGRSPVPPGGLRQKAYRERRTVVGNTGLSAGEWRDLLPADRLELESVLLAPVMMGEEVMGVLFLANKPGGFTEGDARLASAFAEMAAVALLNSRAVQVLERNQEVLEGLVAERTGQLENANVSLRKEIGERELTEAQLRLSEQRFRDLFENVFDGVFEVDAGGAVLTINSALVSMLGYDSKEALIGAFAAAELWPDAGRVDGLWRKLAAAGSLRGEEVTLRRKDGTLLRGLVNVNAVRDGTGEAVAYQGTIFDITALKLAEEALDAERAQLESVLGTMQDAVVITNRSLGVEYVNPAAQRRFGDVDGRKCFTYLFGRDEPCPWCHNERVFAGEQVSWEWTDGGGRTFEGFATRLHNATGGYSKLEVLHDVSERKAAERTLHAERTRFFGVLDQLPALVYLRGEDHSVVFANRYFRQEFGDPAGRPCYETLGRCSTACEGCDFARVFRGGETVEWEWVAPSGKEYQLHHYPFVDSDGTKLVLALGMDITERKLAFLSEKAAREKADALREVSLALTRTLDVDTVLLSLLDHLRRLVPFDRAKVMLLEGEERLVVRAVLDAGGKVAFPADPRPGFSPSEDPVVHAILSTRETVLIPDIHEHPVFGIRADPAFEHSWLGVPLFARGVVIGMYSLGKRDAASFTAEHQQLAEALSAQAAVAIQNALLFEQVQAARAQMQTLSRRLVEVQETERRAIARELHDEAGQSLTTILFGLRLLEKGLGDDEAALGQIADLKRTTDAVMEELHRLAADLRPASLEHLGLVAALRQHLARIESASGMEVRFMARGLDESRLPSAVEVTLFRIAQEALTNVLRHAHAKHVDVLAERRDDRVVLMVEDDGVGFDADRTGGPGRLGRVGMKERAEALGGTLTIESAPGAGTTVAVEVPCVSASPDS